MSIVFHSVELDVSINLSHSMRKQTPTSIDAQIQPHGCLCLEQRWKPHFSRIPLIREKYHNHLVRVIEGWAHCIKDNTILDTGYRLESFSVGSWRNLEIQR